MEDNEIISKLCDEAAQNTPDVYDKILKAAKAQGLINSSGSGSASVKVSKTTGSYGAPRAVAKVAVASATKKVVVTIIASIASIFVALALVLTGIYNGWFGGNSGGSGLGDGGKNPEISTPGDDGSGGGSTDIGSGGTDTETDTGTGTGTGNESSLTNPPITFDGLKYVLSDDGTYYNCAGFSDAAFAEIVISSEVEGKPVKGIAGKAFGFESDEHEKRLIITSVTIPEGITCIGDNAFYYCFKLTEIKLPDSLTTIGDSAFYNCSGFTEVTIPDSLTAIGDKAFEYCWQLKNVNIPKNVTSIGEDVFGYCYNIEQMTVDSANPVYFSAGNCIIEKSSKTLISGCKNSVIPDDGSVTSIGSYAFYGHEYLQSIVLPDSVTSIGDYAFYDCRLKNGINLPDGLTYIGERAFYDCLFLDNIIIPSGVKTIKESTFAKYSNLRNVTLSEGLTSIGDYAFYNSYVTEISFPSSVTSIGKLAFAKTHITEVTVPATVTEISERAFEACAYLTKATISAYHICEYAFNKCTFMREVSIYSTYIDKYAFSGCGVQKAYISDNLADSKDYRLYNEIFSGWGIGYIEFGGTTQKWMDVFLWIYSMTDNQLEAMRDYATYIPVNCSDGTVFLELPVIIVE